MTKLDITKQVNTQRMRRHNPLMRCDMAERDMTKRNATHHITSHHRHPVMHSGSIAYHSIAKHKDNTA